MGLLARQAETRLDALAAQALAREALPDDRDRTLKAMVGDEVGDGVAAHPDRSGVAVDMAKHGLRRHDAFESAVHGLQIFYQCS